MPRIEEAALIGAESVVLELVAWCGVRTNGLGVDPGGDSTRDCNERALARGTSSACIAFFSFFPSASAGSNLPIGAKLKNRVAILEEGFLYGAR